MYGVKVSTHTKSTTSLDSFADQSSGCHTVWCCAARQDVSWGQRYVRWHQGKSRLEICHVELHTKDEERWVLCLVLPPHYSLFFVFVSRSHVFLRWAPKIEALCWWCPEGIFVFCLIFQRPSQPPRARNEKMETLFCVSKAIWLVKKKNCRIYMGSLQEAIIQSV